MKNIIKLPYVLLAYTALALSNTSVYAEGYQSPDSIAGASTISAEKLIQLANQSKNLVIIDSRLNADRDQGFIPDSISLPDTQTNCDSLSERVTTKDTPSVFYCNGVMCRRSDRAVIIARDCGFTRLYWFRGGFEEWKDKEYMIDK